MNSFSVDPVEKAKSVLEKVSNEFNTWGYVNKTDYDELSEAVERIDHDDINYKIMMKYLSYYSVKVIEEGD